MKNVMLIMLGLVLVAGSANAAVLYEADFETPTFPTGGTSGNGNDNITVDGEDSWVVDAGTGVIATDYVITGDQSLVVMDITTDGKIHRDFTASTTYVTLEFKAKISASGKRGRIKLNNGTSEICVMGFGSQDFFAYGDGGAGVLKQELGSWSGNTVYDIKVVADIAAQRYDFIVDGTTLADDYYFSSTVTQLDRVRLEGPDRNVKFAIDGLTVTDVPEPATMTLLLLGLPFALRRRR